MSKQVTIAIVGAGSRGHGDTGYASQAYFCADGAHSFRRAFLIHKQRQYEDFSFPYYVQCYFDSYTFAVFRFTA